MDFRSLSIENLYYYSRGVQFYYCSCRITEYSEATIFRWILNSWSRVSALNEVSEETIILMLKKIIYTWRTSAYKNPLYTPRKITIWKFVKSVIFGYFDMFFTTLKHISRVKN